MKVLFETLQRLCVAEYRIVFYYLFFRIASVCELHIVYYDAECDIASYYQLLINFICCKNYHH